MSAADAQVQQLPRRHPRAPRPPSRTALALVVAAAAAVLPAHGALAQPAGSASVSSSCPAGNLLAGRRPVHWQDMQPGRDLGLVTDGVVTPEGAVWDAPLAVVLDTGAATLTYDLGGIIPVQALYVQADANDVYTVWGSEDGREFRPLGRVEAVDGVHGLRQRKVAMGGAPIRFLRFGEGVGDNFYSLSELQAFCQIPDPFPPPLQVRDAPQAQAKTTIYTYWNNDASSRWEMVLAVLAFLLLGWGWTLAREGRAHVFQRLRNFLLGAVGVISFFTYFNFGFFHFPNFFHDWEWTHYYIGSKYFKELSYDKLYECIAIADAEDGLRKRVEIRKMTNLRTNVLEESRHILQTPERCKGGFSEARWQDFKRDVKFFRDRQTARRWDDLQTDHGYNGTPVWNIAGSVLANLAPASKAQINILGMLDPLYVIAMCGVIWWAFGWRVTAVALAVFATNFPSRFYWTGGAYLRWDWLFYSVAAVCCLKKDRPLLGGLALGYATLLRVFPMFMFVGPVLGAGYALYRQGRNVDWVSRFKGDDERSRLLYRYLRFFAGAALSVAVLVPLSLAVSGGPKAYTQFVQNTAKHKETPLTNYMGLRTVVAYRPSEAGHALRNDRFTDPWEKWKQARLVAWKQARPVYVLLVAGFLVLLGFAVRDRAPWMAVALSTSFIVFGVELTCYYYAFIIAVALLHSEDQRVGRLLLLLTAFTGFVDWAPIKGMPGWLDEKYTLMSGATLLAFVIITWRFGLGPWLDKRAEARAATEQGAVADAKGNPLASMSPGAPLAKAPAAVSDEQTSASTSSEQRRAGGGVVGKKKKRR